MRFTLPKLFLVVTLAALACAGLTLRTRFWVELIFSITVLLFLVTGLLAVGRSGRARISSLAFASVGGGYLLLVSCNVFSPIRDLLLTNRALIVAGRALHVPAYEPPNAPGSGWGGGGGGGFQVADPGGSANGGSSAGGVFNGDFTSALEEYGWNNSFAFGVPIADPKVPAAAFLIIGHCVWSWLLALLAGWLGGAMWFRREKSTADSPARR
jgi:hypothetical protein